MQQRNIIYDVAVIGGGLAGLSLSIQLAQKGFSVILFEKEKYPFHKVCGEYISMESWSFLERLGVPLKELQLPIIDTLVLTAPNGKTFKTTLPLGGFGISRYLLDNYLARLARKENVLVQEGARVVDVVQANNLSTVHFEAEGGKYNVQARLCAGAYGKRSNLDVKWKRAFINSKDKRLNNYIAVKYHVSGYAQPNTISLHNFPDGYCGISEVEKGVYCLCYLTTAQNLQIAGNTIDQLEDKILKRNPVLASVLEQCVRLDNFPVTIAQISFSIKTWQENGVFMLGDAAGMITPLCGNGMSMALHSSNILSKLIQQYLNKEISYQQVALHYKEQWLRAFGSRMRVGRLLQRFFGHPLLTNLFVSFLRAMPFLAKPIIKKTHGQPF